MKLYCIVLLNLIIFISTSCSHQYTKSRYFGIQPKYISDIPAQIAVQKCLPWPKLHLKQINSVINANERVLKSLCDKIDDFVLAAFEDQPFMRGISPKLVTKLIDNKLNQTQLPWPEVKKSDDDLYINSIQYYNKYIANHPEWRQWLMQLSNLTRNSDTTLIPFILKAEDKDFNDRGIMVKRKVVEFVNVLVDVHTAELFWVGFSKAVASNSSLPENQATLKSPEWTQLDKQLFNYHHWHDFPGRK